MRVVAALLCCACAAAASAGAAELGARLAGADSSRGEKVFRKCVACHTVEKGGRKKIGPNLWGIVGAAVGAREGFRYSRALLAFGGSWTPERLDAYLAKPRGFVKGGSMSFVGLKREQDRADVIAFLNGMSDSPADFGKSQEASAGLPPPEPEDYGVMVAAPGASETFDACTSCHSERIVAQQGLTREQWDELLDWMVEEQEMEPIKGDARTAILDYLGAHYGPDRPNFPQD
ncbi:MAG: c-type cytochrome [Boseongicola sp. SB0664_bin_43]|uniref:C-type cytochrome n=1 Tax=Boseongicola sp. SB0664_bin_43 TaxID=2604844 RepID=A0A6B0Y412_9RHOB|nr:c-type cytochrome [Boseongicola sp. SB0664_bin_43]